MREVVGSILSQAKDFDIPNLTLLAAFLGVRQYKVRESVGWQSVRIIRLSGILCYIEKGMGVRKI